MIIAKSLNKIYPNGVHAVNNVSIELEPGKFYGIIGNSGSGKTTLLQLLSTLDTPTDGTIHIDGTDIAKIKHKEIARLRANKIGFVFQSFHLHSALTAIQNVMLPMYINPDYTDKELHPKAQELLASVGLIDRSEHYPKQLSGGEQQRVAIARALANDPEYIFADEPSGNLDSKNELIIFDILKSLAQSGKCVVVVTHNRNVKEYADIIFSMTDGKVSTWGDGENEA